MVSVKTDHHPMGAQLKAYDHSTLQTRYHERFTDVPGRFVGHGSIDGLVEPHRTH